MQSIDEESHTIGERERLLALYYSEFRAIAKRVLNRNAGQITLQPTDLAHEAAIRLISSHHVSINNEAHFLALGARVLRKTLIDEIRRRNAIKRGGGVSGHWEQLPEQSEEFDFQHFDEVLDGLAQFEPQGARIVELRFYVGLMMQEVARVLELSESTVHRRWRSARAWLAKEMDVDEAR